MVKIAIDGNIGCGKSTVVEKLRKHDNFKVYSEDIESWGDWLIKYYEDPKKYALGFQLTVLLSHLRQQGEVDDKGFYIYERCSHTCNRIFGSLLVDDDIMSKRDLELCKSYEREFNNGVDALFYLQTTPEICKERIIKRDRSCESSIEMDYLNKLHDKYEDVYNGDECKVDGISIYIIDATQSEEDVLQEILNTFILHFKKCIDI
tara:strand:- start:542 stop:1156 length:615 start_codon:yes stop_codon:yes gene_type:complete